MTNPVASPTWPKAVAKSLEIEQLRSALAAALDLPNNLVWPNGLAERGNV